MTRIRETEVVHEVPDVHAQETVTYRQSPFGMIEKAVVYIFGLIQLVILLRIVLLLVAAREGNDIVAFVYNVSDVLVAPFRGILRLEQIAAGQTALDIAAIVALIGWTIIELLVLGLVRMVRPTPA